MLLGVAPSSLVAPSPAAATPPVAEGLLAYVAPNPDHDSSLEIYTIARNGTSRTSFSNHPGRDRTRPGHRTAPSSPTPTRATSG